MSAQIKPLADRKAFIHYLNSIKNNDMNVVESYLSQLKTEHYNEIPVIVDDNIDYRSIIRYSYIDFEFAYAKYNKEYYLILFADEIDEFCDDYLEEILYDELNKIPADLKQFFDVKKWRKAMKKKGAEKILSYNGIKYEHNYDGTTIHIFKQKDLND